LGETNPPQSITQSHRSTDAAFQIRDARLELSPDFERVDLLDLEEDEYQDRLFCNTYKSSPAEHPVWILEVP